MDARVESDGADELPGLLSAFEKARSQMNVENMDNDLRWALTHYLQRDDICLTTSVAVFPRMFS
jgi:hypothetical protein